MSTKQVLIDAAELDRLRNDSQRLACADADMDRLRAEFATFRQDHDAYVEGLRHALGPYALDEDDSAALLRAVETMREEAEEEVGEAEADAADEAAVRERLSALLTQTADALKGPPGPLRLHDWSDLPKVAAEARARLRTLEAGEMRKHVLHAIAVWGSRLHPSDMDRIADAIMGLLRTLPSTPDPAAPGTMEEPNGA